MNKPDMQSLQNMSLSNLLGLYALTGIAIAGLVGYFLIIPQIESGQQTADKVRLVEAEIDAYNQLIEDTETLRRNFESVKRDRDQILSLLPQNDNEGEYMLALVSQTAARNGVDMSSFQSQGTVPSTGGQGSSGTYKTYRAEASIAGKYGQLIGFLNDIESSSRFIYVTELTSSTGNNLQVPGNPGITATVTLEAYYQTGSAASSGNETGNQGEGR